MRKMGESQIIQFFSDVLVDEIQSRHGNTYPYSIGNFSGSQDRKFADFFAGTDSVNVLIEFKEFKKECSDEKNKPLREKLCRTLTTDISDLSRKCHFIGWGESVSPMSVALNPYIDLVCLLWGCSNHLEAAKLYLDSWFVKAFTNGNGEVGVSIDEFVRYIDHLNSVAGGSASGMDVPFRSILFSRNDNGRLIANRFENLAELRALTTMKPARKPGPDFSHGMDGP